MKRLRLNIRLAAASVATILLLIGVNAAAADAPPTSSGPSDVEWQNIAAYAQHLVAEETPVSALPFKSAAVGSGRKLVIAHYFPPFPLSLDNMPSDRDYYAMQYLRPGGESKRFLRQRGFLRERPLAVTPQVQRLFRQTNVAIDVARAARIGIDGFGLDLLSLDYMKTNQVGSWLLNAAHVVSPRFRIAPEPDMTSLGTVTVNQLAEALVGFASYPAAFKLADGKLLVIPFAAEARSAAWWGQLESEMASRGVPIALVPDFVSARTMASMAPVSWGATVWGGRDPATEAAGVKVAAQARATGIARWFMPVATQDARPKDMAFQEAGNSAAFRAGWRAAIDSQSFGVHILTWNDYSETSELSPSSFTQFSYYDLAGYYIAWFKRGSPPPLLHDALYYFQRNQILDPTNAKRGTISLHGETALSNDIEMVGLLTKPGRLVLTSAGKTVSQNVGAGLQTLRVPASPGTPRFSLLRQGQIVLAKTSDWPINADPDRFDATYGGGSTSRTIIRTP